MRKFLTSKICSQPILMDNFGRFHNYLRISLTERCNFKCRYCSVSDESIVYTPKNQLLEYNQFFHLTKLFVQAGVDKIRLTGGEPTIYPHFDRFLYDVGQLKEIKSIGVTSNGSVLWKKLDEYQKNGLTHLNISLDTFRPEKNEYITQTKFHHNVLKSIDRALELGYKPLKVNCVVMKGVNDNEILDFVEWVKDKPINIRFIEFFAIGDNQWSSNKMVSFQDMKNIIESKYGPLQQKAEQPNDTAKNFTLPGFVGSISFITPATENFCSTCNRVRLLSTGEFRRCLHDDHMLNIKELLSKGYPDDIILEAISVHLKGKKRQHADMDFIAEHMKHGKSMVKIGG